MFNHPRQFPVKIKKLVTEPAGALFRTFCSKCLKVESKMTACMRHTQARTHTRTDTHTELADGGVSLTQLFVVLSQCE